MNKAIYLNVLAHIESRKNAPVESELALREVDQAIRQAAERGGTTNKLSLEVKRVRVEPASNTSGLRLGILIYLQGDQDAPSSFTKLATGELQTFLQTVFRRASPSGLMVTVLHIEENTNAVDELADEAAGDP